MRRGDYVWGIAIGVLITFPIIPFTNAFYIQAVNSQPYLAGFLKFAILSTMGELLVFRIMNGKWEIIKGLAYKAFVWGIFGIAITFMFSFYPVGVNGILEQIHLRITMNRMLFAFLSSAMMNLTFGIVFMALHQIIDLYIEIKIHKPVSKIRAIEQIDWPGFIRFVVGKTIPLFWIPAHTIVFLLPPDYRVFTAAVLSIVLGVLLTYAKKRKQKMNTAFNA